LQSARAWDQAAFGASLPECKCSASGHIALHAFPFDAQPELLNSSLFECGLDMVQALAAEHNITPPLVLSQRDVPALTRAVVPLLAKAGVIGVNVGINDASLILPPPFVSPL
jgi:hypothetical protein